MQHERYLLKSYTLTIHIKKTPTKVHKKHAP